MCTDEPIPVRLDYPLDRNLNPESHWGSVRFSLSLLSMSSLLSPLLMLTLFLLPPLLSTLPHISPPLLNNPKGSNNSSATTPIPLISRPPGHHHPFRYTYNPMGGAGAGASTYAPPSPPSMEQDEGLVYVDGSEGGSGGDGAEMQAAYGLGAEMGGR